LVPPLPWASAQIVALCPPPPGVTHAAL